ncbi:MAG: zinc-dependent alcohol dehydrogenase family protein [Proteobacteria bacterium]|nr:zinc-dependent alcohol dehydrogenase family protein [Pseudomonadota bacterium]
MRAMRLRAPADVATHPLALADCAMPEPGPGEVLVRVEVCGVCRTDLHIVEGELAPQREEIVPGHQVVGRVERCGPGAAMWQAGDRVGIAWLHRACGTCRFCARGDENLCLDPRFTGWHANGGFAEYAVAPAAFVYRVPESLPAREIAPLLCAGIIGWRALVRSRARRGSRLGLWGFGASAHIAIQVARHLGCEVFVFSRATLHGDLARELGATWVGGSEEAPPAPLDAAILFAPAGELVPVALERLDRGGTLAVAGIHLSDVPALDYQRHLFQERTLTSVTANTREDGRVLLHLAAAIPIRTHTTLYPLERANEALDDLKNDRVRGAAVLDVGPSEG